ncbi:YorP family protein [Alkalihalophilus pseudofirmus]|uniref:YorP family protein n=1 Tax=Alkalihalophilus pseudofirmus TaxID=79885 RepID=UPI00259BCF2C|nr:YorP family protein [Alkalihalophilus pseudofirmus]WEG18639.1 YorP family protein [Alkalihalophilus pseudofirmus]
MKLFKYSLYTKVKANKNASYTYPDYSEMHGHVIEQLDGSMYDYDVKLSDGGTAKFKEEELDLIEDAVYEGFTYTYNDEKGTAINVDYMNRKVELMFGDGSYKTVDFEDVEPFHLGVGETNINIKNTGKFEEIGQSIGALVDSKQEAYGDSFSKAFDLIKVFLRDYKNEDDTYTIPEALLQHILIQVRIIDKQNRIFSNPNGDLLSESTYNDIAGYSLLADGMTKR